jgi:hypothetical protein
MSYRQIAREVDLHWMRVQQSVKNAEWVQGFPC